MRNSTIFGIAVTFLIYLVFIISLWKMGFFNFDGTDSDAKVVAASISMVGALFGSVVSIIGLVLKHSMDQRNLEIKKQTEKRLELESHRNNALAVDAEERRKLESIRNNALAVEAEERLKLDTAIRAVGLLSISNGDPAPETQRVGALFALTSLKRYELATTLTSLLIAENGIDAGSAASVLNRAIGSDKPEDQENAITVFREHLEKFLKPNGSVELPERLYNWTDELTDYTREWGFLAVTRLMLLRPFSKWRRTQLLALLAVLGLAWTTEQREKIKTAMGVIIKKILPAFPNVRNLRHPCKKIDIESIRVALDAPAEAIVAYRDLIEDLEDWVQEAKD
jgi:hypothetical protein